MSGAIVIASSDAEDGKTVFCAALASALGSHYWRAGKASSSTAFCRNFDPDDFT